MPQGRYLRVGTVALANSFVAFKKRQNLDPSKVPCMPKKCTMLFFLLIIVLFSLNRLAMKRYLLPLLLLPAVTHADFAVGDTPISVYGGAYAAKVALKGNAGPSNNPGDNPDIPLKANLNRFDVKNELGLDDANQWVFWVGLEHNNSPWPKLQIHHSSLSESGKGMATRSIAYGNFPELSMDISLSNKLSIHATDMVGYYTLPNVPFRLDLGGGLRRLQVSYKMSINDKAIDFHPAMPPHMHGTVEGMIDEHMPEGIAKKTTQHIPIFYANAYKQLPLRGTYVSFSTVASRFKDRKLYTNRFAMGWRSDYKLGIEAGYSHQRHRFKGSDTVDIDIKIGGPYAAVSLSF